MIVVQILMWMNIKGLTFASDGIMYATTADSYRYMYAVDLEHPTQSYPSYDYEAILVTSYSSDGKDFQACACMSAGAISNTVDCDNMLANASITAESCDLNDGEISLSPSAGGGGYNYNWSNGSTTYLNSNLSNGTYSCQITSLAGCDTTFSFDVPLGAGCNVISGKIFRDFNGDNIYDNTDQAQGAVRIDLFEDINSNQSFDLGTDVLVDTNVSIWDGSFSFSQLNNGDYIIVPRAEDTPHADIFNTNSIDYTMTGGYPAFTVDSNTGALNNQNLGYSGESIMCFAKADDGDYHLYILNRFSGYNEDLGGASSDTDALVLFPSGDALYGHSGDDNEMININMATGLSEPISGSNYGTYDGECGETLLGDDDFEAMAEDPAKNIIYAIQESNECSDADILIAIDRTTATAVNTYLDRGGNTQNIFNDNDGDGEADYYVKLHGDESNNFKGVAIDPQDGTMYVVESGNDIFTIDPSTGEVSAFGELNEDQLTGHIYSLSFGSEGILYGTTEQSNKYFYAIDIQNAVGVVPDKIIDLKLIATFTGSGSDFEACACISAEAADICDGLIANESVVNESCSNQNGSITLDPFGAPPFDYSWATGQSTASINNLSAGDYEVTITSQTNACEMTFTISVGSEMGCECSEALTYDITASNTILWPATSTDLSIVDYVDEGGTIQWQMSSNNMDWSDLSGANASTYTTDALNNTVWYRVQITQNNCTFTSDALKIWVRSIVPIIWEGDISTDWGTNGNWQGDELPLPGEDVRIPEVANGNVYPILDQTRTVGEFILDENATIDLNENRLSISKHLSCNGTFDQTTGEIKMEGSEPQIIEGSGTLIFNDLTVENAAGVLLNTNANFRGEISAREGVLNLNDKDVILLSTEDKTGSIGRIYDGADVSGDLTLQRFFPAGPGGWRMLCSPFEDLSFEQWNDDFTTTGFEGADYPTYPSAANPWSNIRSYDETRYLGSASYMDTGFVSIGSITDTMSFSKGYFVYMVPGPTTIDMHGNWHKGDVEEDLDYTNSESILFNDGWNLMANPYPSAIDWNAGMGWEKTDLDNAVYLYNPVDRIYAGYVNGIEINGATGRIASSQAFWVKSSSGNPSLSFNEKVKTNLQGNFFKSVDMQTVTTIRIKLESDDKLDEMVLAFNNSATHGYDGSVDMYKMHSPSSSVIEISGVSPLDDEQREMSVCVIPVPDEEIDIDLLINKGAYTEFTITNDLIDSFDENICLVLEDKELGIYSPFNTGDSYEFVMGDSSLVNRFSLRVSAPLEVDKQDQFCADISDGKVVCLGFGQAPWNYTWYDQDSNIIRETTNSFGPDTLSNLTPDLYYVVVENQNTDCTSATKVILLIYLQGCRNAKAKSIY